MFEFLNRCHSSDAWFHSEARGTLSWGEGSHIHMHCLGTDLTWLVDGRMMSYNVNTRVGAIRSNVQSDQTAILMRVESRGDGSGVASRMSVLTISALPSARASLTVACHNGSTDVIEEFMFWRREAGKRNPASICIRGA